MQYFLLPVLLGRSIISCVLANSLYALATIWYAYITHLGYRGNASMISLIFYYYTVLYALLWVHIHT